jgi:AcrR family transcriptional regulator
MSGALGRRTIRQELTRRQILEAAWEVAREQGLPGLTMRDLGGRVGMRAQSLYSYFPSKHAIYDAMFAQGNRAMLDRYAERDGEMNTDGGDSHRDEPDARLRWLNRIWMQFCAEDPVRHQLLIQRPIPGFTPSLDSYRVAGEVLEVTRAAVHACGITSPEAFDMFTGLTAGLVAQQNANDPGGTRWLDLADEAVDMFLQHYRHPHGGPP